MKQENHWVQLVEFVSFVADPWVSHRATTLFCDDATRASPEFNRTESLSATKIDKPRSRMLG